MHVFKSFIQPIRVNVVLIALYIANGKLQESELNVLSNNQLSGPGHVKRPKMSKKHRNSLPKRTSLITTENVTSHWHNKQC